MASKRITPNAVPAADTVSRVLPAPPRNRPTAEPIATLEKSARVLGAGSSEPAVSNEDAAGLGLCLARHEVDAYLGASCPRALRARVEAHTVACRACGRWVQHVDDEILEYVGGQRSEDELARMDAHLEACGACRGLVHHVVHGMAQSWHGEQRDGPGSGTTFVAGSVINSRYLIRKFVGRGGMGEVYEAFDRLMDRRIALKTMLHTVADRPRAARRFKEEVRNAQRVGHPHVCRINDLQEHRDGVFGPALTFFTMEFIDGERLGNVLQASTLAIEDARVIAMQLLGGLAAAHQSDVLHLDFKSDNVMLRRNTERPEAVIMDFGLSRSLGAESRLRSTDRRQLAGTLPYMAVEQLECREDLGPATDVYAFGVVLYEVLTRALPFDGESLGAVLLKQRGGRPKPPSQHVPSLAPALDRFVLKCLSPDPRARYASAGEALQALHSLGPWTRRRRRDSRLWKKAIPGAAAAVIIALVARSGLRRESPQQPVNPGSESLSRAPAAQRVEQLTRELAPVIPPRESAASDPGPVTRTSAQPEAPASPAPVSLRPVLPAPGSPAAAPEQRAASRARDPRTPERVPPPGAESAARTTRQEQTQTWHAPPQTPPATPDERARPERGSASPRRAAPDVLAPEGGGFKP